MHPMLRTLWLAVHHHWCSVRRAGLVGCPLGVLLGLGLMLVGCNNSGNQGRLAPQSSPTLAMERQVVSNLLTLYLTALRQADIDRVDALLSPAASQAQAVALEQQSSLRQGAAGAVTDVEALRATLSATFRTRTVTALDIPTDIVQVAPDNRSVTFLEIETTEASATLVQQTRLFRTTWGLTQDEVDGTATVRIGAVQREGPLVQVTTPGQVQAGALTRVEVRGTREPFALARVEVTVPETMAVQTLMAIDDAWQGVFTPPLQPSPQPLRVHLYGAGGEALVLQHPYRLRVPGEGVVTRVPGTETTRVFAVAVAPDGTVWAGGDGGATLYQVPPGATRATHVGRLLAHPDGRVEAIVVDQLGRLHALVLDLANNEVVRHGDIVYDPAYPNLFCQTANIFDAAYPFREPHGQLSASTRALAAGEGDIWLFGSDGGVARVQDSFRAGQCPAQGITVRYDPVFRRATSALPTNTVPAFVAEADGTLWFGTALGLTRLQQGHFTPVPFNRTLTVQGDVTTLEAFFQAVAQALFAAQPLTTVALGGVSFVEQFGRPLVKEDLLFTAVAVAPGQLWVGTLGGGLRRIDGHGATPQGTQHLTSLDGLPSNLIVALAVAPDGALWVATDKGVSRLREAGGAVTLTTFAALDGLALPVRDVAVDAAGTVWLATDGGLFRIVPQGGTVQGLVVDAFSRPVVGADVTLQNTPFRAVTDATGHFVLANLPAGPQQLQVDGRLAVGGPFPVALRATAVPDEGTQTLEAVVRLADRATARLLQVSGNNQRGIPGVALPEPLVVRLEDRFGNPLPGETVMGSIITGDGTLLPGTTRSVPEGALPSPPVPSSGSAPVTVTTDAAGTAAFVLRFGTSELTITEVTAQGLPAAVEPVQFLTLVGLISPASIAAETNGRLVIVDPAINAVVGVNQNQIGTVITISDNNTRGSGPLLQLPYGIAVEADGTLVVMDVGLQAVLRVDPSSGDRTIVSDATHGVGPPFQTPVQVAVAADGSLVVTDTLFLGRRAVLRVDPRSGNRTIVSDATTGLGPALQGPIGLAVEANGALVITDVGLPLLPVPTVRRVDPRSGNRTIVSDATTGDGPRLLVPGGIAVETDGSLIVTDVVLNAVLRVDPRSGNRTIVSDATTGLGPALRGPLGVTVAADGALVVTDGALTSAQRAAVLQVDPGSGDRAIIAQGATTRGIGPPFLGGQAQVFLRSLDLRTTCPGEVIAIEADGSFVMTDIVLNAVLRVDPRSGNRTIVSDATHGFGPALQGPGGIAVAADGALVVTDIVPTVLRVDPRSGNRTIVSDATTGFGPPLHNPASIAVAADGSLMVADPGLFDPLSGVTLIPPTLFRVDPRSGNRTIVSDATTGFGPPLQPPASIAVAADGSLMVAGLGLFDLLSGATLIPPTLFRVDPRSGNRTPVSGCFDSNCTNIVGSGPPLLVPVGLAVETNGSLVVANSKAAQIRGNILRVQPSSGDRLAVSDLIAGRGSPFISPTAIAVEAEGHLVAFDCVLAAVVRVDLLTGDRTLVSR